MASTDNDKFENQQYVQEIDFNDIKNLQVGTYTFMCYVSFNLLYFRNVMLFIALFLWISHIMQ